MRVSLAALALVFGGTLAFLPSVPNNFHVTSKNHQAFQRRMESNLHLAKTPEFPTPMVTSKTPISSELTKNRNILEARRCLLVIETAAEQAREYLAYLGEVADVIRSYLKDQSTPPNLNVESVQDATEYLVNIEKATASASEYLEYLEGMAQGIKTYLRKFEEHYAAGKASAKKTQQADEAQTYLRDLEETAVAAKDYLKHLQSVAGVVQKYLADPNLKGIQDFMPAEAQPNGLKTIQDFMAKTNEAPEDLSPRATRVIGTRPKPGVLPPPSPALEVDTTTGPRPVKRISPMMETLNKSTDIAGMSVNPNANGVPKFGTTSQGYLDSIAPSMEARRPVGGERNRDYLDSINNPSFQRQPGGTPTSHFKESAASTPFSETGPPGKGRSDVSHMDNMYTGNTVAAGTMDNGRVIHVTEESTTSTPYSQGFAAAASAMDSGRGDPPSTEGYVDAEWSKNEDAKKVAPGSGMSSYLNEMPQTSQPVDWSSAAGQAPKSFVLEESVEKFFSSKMDSQNDAAERKEGEPIPPQLRFLGSQYMEQLERAASKNPLNLKEELEKRRVVDDDKVTPSVTAPPSATTETRQVPLTPPSRFDRMASSVTMPPSTSGIAPTVTAPPSAATQIKPVPITTSSRLDRMASSGTRPSSTSGMAPSVTAPPNTMTKPKPVPLTPSPRLDRMASSISRPPSILGKAPPTRDLFAAKDALENRSAKKDGTPNLFAAKDELETRAAKNSDKFVQTMPHVKIM